MQGRLKSSSKTFEKPFQKLTEDMKESSMYSPLPNDKKCVKQITPLHIFVSFSSDVQNMRERKRDLLTFVGNP